MKKNYSVNLLCIFFICLIFTACDINIAPTHKEYRLSDYKNVGESVASKSWSADYDCSNFAVQFYQNCYRAGLPCRIRLGLSGGDLFSSNNHAWNSVEINGEWVNWEPQLNDMYNGHRQTWNPTSSSHFYQEDLSRIIYEMIGKYVPESFINLYEIDAYWSYNSPFYPFFVPIAYCLSDDVDPNIQALRANLETIIPDNNSGGIVIFDQNVLLFFFQYKNKYYGIGNLTSAKNDPLEGRSIVQERSVKDVILSASEYATLDIDLSYK
jgi:hypothetical protein